MECKNLLKNKILIATLLLLLPLSALFVSWPSTAEALVCTLEGDCTFDITCGIGGCYCDYATGIGLCTPKKTDGASCTAATECMGARCDSGRCGSRPAGELGGGCSVDSNCTGTGCTPMGKCVCLSLICHLGPESYRGDLGFACLSGGVCNRGDCATAGSCVCQADRCVANLPDGSLGRPCAEGNKCTGVGCEAVGKCECEAGACRFAAGTAEELRDIGFENELVKSSLRRIDFETIPALINFYIKGLLPFVGIWALIFFVFGGIIWLTSGGNPDKIKKAQQMMVWATIGIVFIFASYAIVSRIIPAVGG